VAFRFSSWTLDPATSTLARDGVPVGLQHQPAQLLALLVERAGTIVTREDIQARLWPDTVVEYDQSINYAIRQIRIALGTDSRFIQTVARRGYRFIGSVAQEIPSRRRRVPAWAAAAATVLAAFASGFGAGVVSRDAQVGRFVSAHLMHPDRCPYLRLFFAPQRNS
jgi:DNA-binding winged helix-turn-helix (wHTH) protein